MWVDLALRGNGACTLPGRKFRAILCVVNHPKIIDIFLFSKVLWRLHVLVMKHGDIEHKQPDAPKRRGIQPGQVPWSASSKKLHGKTEDLSKEVYKKWSAIDSRLIWQKKISPQEIIQASGLKAPDDLEVTGVSPDGGIFFYDHPERGKILLCTVEAKEQQNIGNAIERWFKNYTVLSMIDPDVAYLSLCSGEGAVWPKGQICRTLNHTLLAYGRSKRFGGTRVWNKLYDSGPSLYHSVEGYSDAMIGGLIDRLVERRIAQVQNM
jgi:hypothetical protein